MWKLLDGHGAESSWVTGKRVCWVREKYYIREGFELWKSCLFIFIWKFCVDVIFCWFFFWHFLHLSTTTSKLSSSNICVLRKVLPHSTRHHEHESVGNFFFCVENWLSAEAPPAHFTTPSVFLHTHCCFLILYLAFFIVSLMPPHSPSPSSEGMSNDENMKF